MCPDDDDNNDDDDDDGGLVMTTKQAEYKGCEKKAQPILTKVIKWQN